MIILILIPQVLRKCLKMNQLIISADDFGLTESVTKGIYESIVKGAVTRTSAMMCTYGSTWIKKYSEGLDGKIGLHLQLTDGTPLLPSKEIPSLINSNGNFPPQKTKHLYKVNILEIEKEWEAQMRAMLDLGITPSHIDTHHSVHQFPKVFKAYCAIAKKYKLPMRSLTPNMSNKLELMGLLGSKYCFRSWFSEDLTCLSLIDQLLQAFQSINNNGIIELMCHPGYVDQDLKYRSHYLKPREKELAIFLDPQLKVLLAENKINLI